MTEEQIKTALDAVAKHIFNDSANAWQRQRNCMHHHLFFLEGNFKKFKERLQELNHHLKCFPITEGRTKVDSLAEDELLEIIDRKKSPQYQQALLLVNYDIFQVIK